jgi:YVTN family beta-propeller protein
MTRKALIITVLAVSVALAAGPAVDHYMRSCGLLSANSAVIPLNWALHPAGYLVQVGEMPFGGALSPDGRTLAVSNDGEGEQAITLIAIGRGARGNPKTHLVMPLGKGALYWGLAFSPDSKCLYAAGGGCNQVWVYDLTRRPVPDPTPISMIPPDKPKPPVDADDASKYAGGQPIPPPKKGYFPAGLAVSADGTRLYVTDVLEGAVVVVDTATRAVVQRLDVGRYPYAVITGPDRNKLYVSRWGDRMVVVVDLKSGKVVNEIKTDDHPCAFAVSPTAPELYCANSNSDTVTVIDTKSDRAVATVDMHPYQGAPAGSCPNALAVSPDGTRLYVANAGNNDVAVVDTARREVIGLIPTGWYPTAVAVSPRNREMYIVSAKGLGAGPNPQGQYIANMLHGLVSILRVPDARRLARYTRQVMEDNDFGEGSSVRHTDETAGSPVPRRLGGKSPIKHVFYFIKENRTYDQILGDMPRGNGAPSLALFGKQVTPNHHAISEEFVLLDNLYCDSTVSIDGHEWCKAANVSDAFEKTWPGNYGQRGPLIGGPVRAPTAGYIWDACKRAGRTCKIYGGPIRSGADLGTAKVVLADIAKAQAGAALPDLLVIHLPCDHTMGTRPGGATPRAMVAENDLALGRILEGLSKSRFWSESLFVAVEDDAQDGPDHVDAHRTVAVIAGPYVRRGIVDSTMYDQCSIVRTIELILGLQPMSQFDAAATPMFASFTDKPDLRPYVCKLATWPVNEVNRADAYGAKESLAMDFSEVDRAPWQQLNRVLWYSIKGPDTPYPETKLARYDKGVSVEDDDD